MKKTISIVPVERIEKKIYYLRGVKVMLDRDLSELYGVPTKVFNQTVRRNRARFPDDFMFKLDRDELENLRSQIVTLHESDLHGKYTPYVFTEQGVAMLSSVLRSKKAILVNIQIVRTFTKLREMIAENDALLRKLDRLESKYDTQFKAVFEAIKKLVLDKETHKEEPRREIGFKVK